MNYNKIDETFIFEAKEAFDKISTKSLSSSQVYIYRRNLENHIHIPDLELIREQIFENINNSEYPDQYINNLKINFKDAFDLIEDLRKEKYNLKSELRELEYIPKSCGLEFDYDESNKYFIFQKEHTEEAVNKYPPIPDGKIKNLMSWYYEYSKKVKERDYPRRVSTWRQVCDLLMIYNETYDRLNKQILLVTNLLELAEYLQEILSEAKKTIEQKQLPIEVIEDNSDEVIQPELTAISHKVVLLYELGIIEYLTKVRNEKYPTLSNKQFAKLIGFILGIKGNSETIRKCISGYGQHTKDDPKSKKALKAVKAELSKIDVVL